MNLPRHVDAKLRRNGARLALAFSIIAPCHDTLPFLRRHVANCDGSRLLPINLLKRCKYLGALRDARL